MNKTTKGAFAATTAAVLLLGGAGTLAYWNDTATVDGTTFTAGELELDAADCTTAGWTVSNTVEGVTDAAFVPGTDKVVPGDVLEKECEVDITAVGENLTATLGVTGGATTASTMAGSAYSVDSDFTQGGAALNEISSANNGETVDALITVTFNLGGSVDNVSQLKTIDLADFTVTATQAVS